MGGTLHGIDSSYHEIFEMPILCQNPDINKVPGTVPGTARSHGTRNNQRKLLRHELQQHQPTTIESKLI